MSDKKKPHSAAFELIVGLALALGARGINRLAGCLECEIDEHWWVAVNGHPTPTQCSRGIEVAPYRAYVEFNGWPAGLLDPRGGVLAAGRLANEDELVAAIERRLAAIGQEVKP